MLGSILLALIATLLGWFWWPAGAAVLLLIAPLIWFFRDPQRIVPDTAGAVLAPADGRVVSLDRIEDEFVGAAWSIGIFLSVLNVHMNRSPIDAIVIGQTYQPGKFLNALRPRSARENESLDLRLQQISAPYWRIRVRQIAGALARRIVCWAAPGQEFAAGSRLGMIKIGSRTELVIPACAKLNVRIGDNVRAGITVVAWTQPANC
jgi:phosphatidylserine decarboxylase